MRDFLKIEKTTEAGKTAMHRDIEIVNIEANDHTEFEHWYNWYKAKGYEGKIERKKHWSKGYVYYKVLMKK